MLELDLLLNCFLDRAYPGLERQQQADFVRLLGYEDQIIYDWLMGHSVPADSALKRLVGHIRQAMRP
jgi:antitoxin CptB